MNTSRQGFTPSNYLERIKPPLISFGLIMIGVVLAVLGGVFIILRDTVELGILPTVTLFLGLALILTSAGYLIGRYIRRSEAKREDENNFQKWVVENYNVTLSKEQKDQLYNYGSTVVEGKRYILNHDSDEDGNDKVYLFTEAEIQERVETGLIQTLNSVPEGFYPENEDDEELIEQARKAEQAELNDTNVIQAPPVIKAAQPVKE